ncbi:hypothetical protein FA13DRAFT_1716117 [Coprinellus micaceus]|uniref:Uncharacterized protein n=1 Tax=Coprinellus micaceus TaxID=71717 RepID=A0A4Y7SL88_COPMI|nr:hypothetical protein FA13DRAFT_1716117 [Coprinellus micaceus]
MADADHLPRLSASQDGTECSSADVYQQPKYSEKRLPLSHILAFLQAQSSTTQGFQGLRTGLERWNLDVLSSLFKALEAFHDLGPSGLGPRAATLARLAWQYFQGSTVEHHRGIWGPPSCCSRGQPCTLVTCQDRTPEIEESRHRRGGSREDEWIDEYERIQEDESGEYARLGEDVGGRAGEGTRRVRARQKGEAKRKGASSVGYMV